jgi:CBS domain-containing protein
LQRVGVGVMIAHDMKLEQSLRHLEVLALALQPPLALDRSTRVGDVIKAMRDRGLGYALITQDDRLAGIFTERDVLLSVLDNAETLSQPVSKHMTAQPICVSESDPVWQAVVRMHEGGFRQLPVVDSGSRVVGCVRHKDVAEYLVDHFADHVLTLPPDPEQRARAPEGG